MIKKVLIIFSLAMGKAMFSQIPERIEFESFNSIAIDNVNIVLTPIKNNIKGKVRVRFTNKENSFTRRISQKEYINISTNILSIKQKISFNAKDSIKTRCLDGSSIEITIFQNNIKKKYFLDCISPEDKMEEERKDFWYATKLILETVRIKIENLY
ncbi:hypothetical protein [Chryseobacterium taeanense]|uniref:hypothetical protein n=1 Tax=Chryseobacterium taeanense TaxID=311334 RepID=UPI0035B0919E